MKNKYKTKELYKGVTLIELPKSVDMDMVEEIVSYDDYDIICLKRAVLCKTSRLKYALKAIAEAECEDED